MESALIQIESVTEAPLVGSAFTIGEMTRDVIDYIDACCDLEHLFESREESVCDYFLIVKCTFKYRYISRVAYYNWKQLRKLLILYLNAENIRAKDRRLKDFVDSVLCF